MRRLDDIEFMPYAPDEPGTVRVNHDSSDCSGTSKSLKITRTDDDRVFAKCFRCGGFGSHNGSLSRYGSYASATRPAVAKVGNEVKLPYDFDQDVGKMPASVRLKLHEGGVTQADVTTYGMGWSDKWSRFVIPVYRGGEMKGFVARYFGNDPEISRFITRYKDDSDLWSYLPASGPVKHTGVVVVEDMWSGIRVSKFCPALVLMGTEMGDKCLDFASSKHDKFLIFLDDDNTIVKRKAVAIKDRLTMTGGCVTIFNSGGKDPKEHSDIELKKILEDNL